MTAKSLSAIVGIVLLASFAAGLPARAQMPTPTQSGASSLPSSTLPGSPPRVEVNPRRLLYRRCEDRYVIQNRPSGTVLFPERHCWWVRG